MSTTSLPASEESEEPECAICKETPGPQAIVMPCKHEFDLVCINTWIYSGRAAASACPACRTVMTHIHHSQDDRGNAMCDAVQPSGNYIHDDEEEEEEEEDSFDEDDDNEEDAIVNLSPNHSRESNEGEAENDRRTAFLPRVTLPIRPRNSEAFFEALFVDEWLEVEDHAVNIQRRMGIRILQRDTFTETTLERKLIVRRRELADEISVTETSAEKLALYEVVMKEIGYATEDMAESWRTFRDVGPRFDIMNDRRGLGVRLQRMYVVLKRGRFGEFPREIEVVWKTELKEYISVYADGEVGDSDENLQDIPFANQSAEDQLKNTTIIQSTGEVQGIVEYFEHHGHAITLDRAGTNIREAWTGECKCSFCDLSHRSGDCIIPTRLLNGLVSLTGGEGGLPANTEREDDLLIDDIVHGDVMATALELPLLGCEVDDTDLEEEDLEETN